MVQVYAIGRVTADLKLQYSEKDIPYIRFSLAEQIKHKGNWQTQYLQIWAFADDAKRLIKSKVKKGSLITVSGELILEEFQKANSTASDKRLKVMLSNWNYLQYALKGIVEDNPSPTIEPDISSLAPEIDGDRETLPS